MSPLLLPISRPRAYQIKSSTPTTDPALSNQTSFATTTLTLTNFLSSPPLTTCAQPLKSILKTHSQQPTTPSQYPPTPEPTPTQPATTIPVRPFRHQSTFQKIKQIFYPPQKNPHLEQRWKTLYPHTTHEPHLNHHLSRACKTRHESELRCLHNRKLIASRISRKESREKRGLTNPAMKRKEERVQQKRHRKEEELRVVRREEFSAAVGREVLRASRYGIWDGEEGCEKARKYLCDSGAVGGRGGEEKEQGRARVEDEGLGCTFNKQDGMEKNLEEPDPWGKLTWDEEVRGWRPRRLLQT